MESLIKEAVAIRKHRGKIELLMKSETAWHLVTELDEEELISVVRIDEGLECFPVIEVPEWMG
jgi:hypothetical protein